MFRISLILPVTLLLCLNTTLFSQSRGINRDNYRINISETNSTINIDGILDEDVWQSTDIANHFHRVLPTDTGFASSSTEIRLTYSESTLYTDITLLNGRVGTPHTLYAATTEQECVDKKIELGLE